MLNSTVKPMLRQKMMPWQQEREIHLFSSQQVEENDG